MIRHFKARISENRPLSKDYYLLGLIPVSKIKEPEPGQFFMISTFPDEWAAQALNDRRLSDPLLKRPFSLFRRSNDGLQILYRVRGKGTSLLSSMKVGSVMSAVGPLGNPYPLPAEDRTPVIIAGGIGMASVFSLAERLGKSEKRPYILYGARTGDEIVLSEELRGYSRKLSICTDDGSLGMKGSVADALNLFLSEYPSLVSESVIYACGSRPMLEAVSRITEGKGIVTYLSMEEYMACGLGACLSCVVKTADGFKRACKEGPVFPAEEIRWG